MDRLTHIVVHTGRLAALRRFYEAQLGLLVRQGGPDRVEFDTGAGMLALEAAPDPGAQGLELWFATDDLEERLRRLAAAGALAGAGAIERRPWGRLARLSDPEGNPLTLWQPAGAVRAGTGPPLSAVVNCDDLDAQKRFYRDGLGFAVTIDSSWWVGLASGAAGLGLHPRTPRPGHARGERHHAGAITIGLTVSDLEAWYEDRVARGAAFASPPADRGFGAAADAVDPDGNEITVREGDDGRTPAERLAEPFEDEAAPRRAAIRKPVRKAAKATSRVALRPRYRATRPAPKRRRAARATKDVVSPRGTGPAGSRRKPKRSHDSKRARAKPATGRLKKAARRTFKSKKQAVAGASKRKPVKRASRPRVAKRTAARRGRGRR